MFAEFGLAYEAEKFRLVDKDKTAPLIVKSDVVAAVKGCEKRAVAVAAFVAPAGRVFSQSPYIGFGKTIQFEPKRAA